MHSTKKKFCYHFLYQSGVYYNIKFENFYSRIEKLLKIK